VLFFFKKTMMKVILISILSLSMSQSLAKSCSTIDLDKNNGAMAKVKPLDQGYTNTCYAHAGTVMLDAWLHSHGGDKSKQTSSVASAVFSQGSVMSAGLGNISCSAIDAIYDHGRCEKTGFDDKVWNEFADGMGESGLWTSRSQRSVKLMDLLGEIYVKPPRRRGGKNFVRRGYYSKKRKWKKENAQRANLIYCNLDAIGLSTFNSMNVKDIENALNANFKSSYLKRMVGALCGEKLTELKGKQPQCKKMMRYQHAENKTPKKFKNKIHEILENPNNPQPIGVGYCAKVLQKPAGFRGFKKGILGFVSLSTVLDADVCGLHESVVIGRKEINGKCHLKIRNSWGADAVYRNWPSDNNGNVWVDEDDFTHNMGSLTHLE